MTYCFVADATTFSISSAPPSPLMRSRDGLTSSAPSIVMSTVGCSSRVVSLSPRDLASFSVAVEVQMPSKRNPSPATRLASALVAQSAVRPVPSPTTVPSRTNDAAISPAASFGSMEGVMRRAVK